MSGLFISTTHSADIFTTLFNVLIILAIGGLWLAWARNVKRQKAVETMLSTASEQLEEASHHLANALQEIKQLQRAKEPQSNDSDGDTTYTQDNAKIEHYRTSTKRSQDDSTSIKSASSPSPESSKSSVQEILQMHRMGQQAEQIAAQLDIPLARVQLLLRLNEQRPV